MTRTPATTDNGLQDLSPREKGEALLRAAYDGTAEEVAALLQSGAPPACCDRNNRTALYHAAGREKPEVLALLLAQPSVRVDTPDDDGMTALHAAIAAARFDNAQSLLDAGADIDFSDISSGRGPRPLHTAFYMDLREAGTTAAPDTGARIKFLIARGADEKAPDKHGRTIISLLAEARLADPGDKVESLARALADAVSRRDSTRAAFARNAARAADDALTAAICGGSRRPIKVCRLTRKCGK